MVLYEASPTNRSARRFLPGQLITLVDVVKSMEPPTGLWSSGEAGKPSAIFLDRDGVLNENRAEHVKNWSEFRFIPGSIAALRILSGLPVRIIGITNQAIIERGIATSRDVDDIHFQMLHEIEKAGGRIDQMYCCPHRPESGCTCRKPKPGMLIAAAQEMNVDLQRSIFVGDSLADIEAGKHAGCRTVLVRSGRGEDELRRLAKRPDLHPDVVASDLLQAVPALLELLQTSEERVPSMLSLTGASAD